MLATMVVLAMMKAAKAAFFSKSNHHQVNCKGVFEGALFRGRRFVHMNDELFV